MQDISTPQPALRDIYTVSRLNLEVRTHLEMGFALLWLEGEISNFSRPASGHFYFSLKDDKAQVRCAMFRMRNMHIGFTPKNGMQVLIRARVSLYEARGEFQLIVEHMEEAGHGALRQAFEELKIKLDQEGLFAREHKKSLPPLPRCIGVVTSPTGAAIHDILHVLQRRFPSIPVILYPVPVQGTEAPPAIADAIQTAGQRGECDVLIVGRGGGSLEDLWAFNDESVARAIFACPIPILSAIGHEVDVTIADFVADQRAPTPSAAAEMLSPDRAIWLTRFTQLASRLQRSQQQYLARRLQQLDWLQRRLKHPGRRLMEISQRLDELEQRLQHACNIRHRHMGSRLNELRMRLQLQHPGQYLTHHRRRRDDLERRLHQAMQQSLRSRQQSLSGIARNLQAISPLATLSRGYSITLNEQGCLLQKSSEATISERIETRLSEGTLYSRIEEVRHEEN